jgi:xanthine dehydrogenase iron-sulfur cluster and FAD-binding subunit A
MDKIGSVQIRNVATIGENIARAICDAIGIRIFDLSITPGKS